MSTAHNTPHEILGVDKDATPEEVKRAYRKLLRSVHPDAGGTDGLFRIVQAAYENFGTDEPGDRDPAVAEQAADTRPTPAPPRSTDERSQPADGARAHRAEAGQQAAYEEHVRARRAARYYPAGSLDITGKVASRAQRLRVELDALRICEPELFGSDRRALAERLAQHREVARDRAAESRTPYPRRMVAVPAAAMAVAVLLRVTGILAHHHAVMPAAQVALWAAVGSVGAIALWALTALRATWGPLGRWEPLPLWLAAAILLAAAEHVATFPPAVSFLGVLLGAYVVGWFSVWRLPRPLTTDSWHSTRAWIGELVTEAVTWYQVTAGVGPLRS